jgi:hypothetical protein
VAKAAATSEDSSTLALWLGKTEVRVVTLKKTHTKLSALKQQSFFFFKAKKWKKWRDKQTLVRL